MTFADLKSPVLLTLLGVFAVGWIALYWVMASQVTAAEAQTLELHGQQSSALQDMNRQLAAMIQDINKQLTAMNGTLERLDERTQYHSTILDAHSTILDALQHDMRQLTATQSANK